MTGAQLSLYERFVSLRRDRVTGGTTYAYQALPSLIVYINILIIGSFYVVPFSSYLMTTNEWASRSQSFEGAVLNFRQ
jgi:hypothetical protein